MGCASSKHHKRCHHCQKRSLSPVRRSYSMNLSSGHRKKDDYRVVALKSPTVVRSMKLDFSSRPIPLVDDYDVGEKLNGNLKLDDAAAEAEAEDKKTEFPAGVLEAKIWSKMIEDKIPKVFPVTPTRTPPGEPETINTWELMEGLEDVATSPFRSPRHKRNFSYSESPAAIDDEPPPPEPEQKIQPHSPPPMWLQMEEDDRVPNFTVPDFDPDVISSFRESFGEHENIDETESKKPDFTIPEPISALRKSLDEEAARKEKELTFEIETEAKRESFIFYPAKKKKKKNETGKEKVVLYFTSLRGVRKTYENCCHARVILNGIGVRVDERDVSMHSGFRDELRELIGDKNSGVLPAVFIGKEFIGGVEEIRHMHEEGQLEKLLAGCETAERDGGVGGGACEVCGDVRFVPCETCNGSCKVYYEEEEEEVGREFGFLRCPDCNENGLIRCPNCCYDDA